MKENAASHIEFPFPDAPGVRCVFTTRHAGTLANDSDRTLRERRAALKRELGFSAWADVRQVHGDALVRATGRTDPVPCERQEADGQYTLAPDTGLVIYAADCQPLVFAKKGGGAVAAIHVGWRGNAMNFPGTAVSRLCETFSCAPDGLLAVRGPSLGPGASEFVNFHSEWPVGFAPWFDAETKRVDLWNLTETQLLDAGMRPGNLFRLDLCTYSLADDFFSYRRAKETGRQAAIVWME